VDNLAASGKPSRFGSGKEAQIHTPTAGARWSGSGEGLQGDDAVLFAGLWKAAEQRLPETRRIPGIRASLHTSASLPARASLRLQWSGRRF